MHVFNKTATVHHHVNNYTCAININLQYNSILGL